VKPAADLSRREFFQELGSRKTLGRLAGRVLGGYAGAMEFLSEKPSPSVAEAVDELRRGPGMNALAARAQPVEPGGQTPAQNGDPAAKIRSIRRTNRWT
jgi:hypothetical protein